MRAAIYARVSTTNQVENGTSLEDQVDRCTLRIASEGWSLVGTFVEEGVSGAKESRPELDRLLEAVMAGEVDTIVTSALDRLGRSQKHVTNLVSDLDDSGIGVVFLREGVDTTTTIGRVVVAVLAALAELEREAIIERMAAGRRRMIADGRWPGGPAPFGLRICHDARDRAFLERDPEESRVVDRIAQLLVDERQSLWAAAKILNAEGMKPRKAGRWTNGSLRRWILDQRGLSGTWTYRSSEGDLTMDIPALVSVERHELLVEILASTATGERKNASGPYPLRGRVTSPHGKLHWTFPHSSGTRSYRCGDSLPQSINPCDCPTSLRADIVEEEVWNAVHELLSNPQQLRDLADAAWGATGEPTVEDAETAATVAKRVNAAEKAMGHELADLLKAGFDPKAANHAVAEMQEDLDELRRRHAHLTKKERASKDRDSHLEALERMMTSATDVLSNPTEEVKQRLIELLDVQVQVIRWDDCPTCKTKGTVVGPRPATGSGRRPPITCQTCLRHGYLPVLRIAGSLPVPSDGDNLDAAVSLPWATRQPGRRGKRHRLSESERQAESRSAQGNETD